MATATIQTRATSVRCLPEISVPRVSLALVMSVSRMARAVSSLWAVHWREVVVIVAIVSASHERLREKIEFTHANSAGATHELA